LQACPDVDIGRSRVVRHSIGEVQLLKFFLPEAVSQPELTSVLQRVILECVEKGLRGALVLDYDRPAMTHAELKAAMAGMDFTRCPQNFRLALVAVRKPAYEAYRYALETLKLSLHAKLFWDELEAMHWLRQQFPEAGTRSAQSA
jgi:hypothetical protein